MSARRMRALVLGIPTGSALHRELDPRAWNWGQTEELLATVAELVDTGNRISVAKAVQHKRDIPRAIVIPRPWKIGDSGRPRGTTMAEFAAMVVADKKELKETDER